MVYRKIFQFNDGSYIEDNRPKLKAEVPFHL